VHRVRVALDLRLAFHRRGGISTYAARLLEALSVQEPASTFIEVRDRRDPSRTDGPPNVRTLRVLTPAHFRSEPFTLPIELLRARADLFHATDSVAPWPSPTPGIVTIHDLTFLRHPGLVTPAAHRYYSRVPRSAGHARAVIAVSAATKHDVVTMLGVPEDRVHVVPLAADAAFRPVRDEAILRTARDRYGLPGRFVLFVGTREPRKNLPALLDACSAMRDGGRPVPLVLVGEEGWLADDLERRVLTQQNVHVLGGVSADELVAIYNLATVVALPSLDEGFGLPVVESMACGTPVVCSREGALPEVAGDAALLVDPHDVDGIAAALTSVMEDAAVREGMRQRGFARSATFGWDRTARETAAVYRSVLDERPS
jgi:glycosyltransferase involved in cell wall biosynthesis